MNIHEICCLISGGFFEANTQCIVAIELAESGDCETVATEAITPEQPADVLMDLLSSCMGQTLDNINVNVYGIAGGLIGKGIADKRKKLENEALKV